MIHVLMWIAIVMIAILMVSAVVVCWGIHNTPKHSYSYHCVRGKKVSVEDCEHVDCAERHGAMLHYGMFSDGEVLYCIHKHAGM